MKTISYHVNTIIQNSPFLEEVLGEGVGNLSAIARLIQKDVEKATLQKVSVQSIVVTLSRLRPKKSRSMFGFKFLKKIENITLESNLQLLVCNNSKHKYIEDIIGIHSFEVKARIIGQKYSLFVLTNTPPQKVLKSTDVTIHTSISSITLSLPKESIPVPGVYYPILKKLSWAGINIVELVSVDQELTFYLQNKDTERAFIIINSLLK